MRGGTDLTNPSTPISIQCGTLAAHRRTASGVSIFRTSRQLALYSLLPWLCHHGRMQLKIPAGVFKARCLALLDEVRDSGTEIIVTKRGKPIARIVPAEAEKTCKSSFAHMKGSAIQLCSDEELFSTGEVGRLSRTSRAFRSVGGKPPICGSRAWGS